MDSLRFAALSLGLTGCIFFVERVEDEELGGSSATAGAAAHGGAGTGGAGGAAGGGGAGGAVCVGPEIQEWPVASTLEPVTVTTTNGHAVVGLETPQNRQVARLSWDGQLETPVNTTLGPGRLVLTQLSPAEVLAATETKLDRCNLNDATCNPVSTVALGGARIDGLVALPMSTEVVVLAGKSDQLLRIDVPDAAAAFFGAIHVGCGSNGCETGRGLQLGHLTGSSSLDTGARVAFFTDTNLVYCAVDSSPSCALPAPIEQDGISSLALAPSGEEVFFSAKGAIWRVPWTGSTPERLLNDVTTARAVTLVAGPGGVTDEIVVALDPEDAGPSLLRCPPNAQERAACKPLCSDRPAVALAGVAEGPSQGVVALFSTPLAASDASVGRAVWPN